MTRALIPNGILVINSHVRTTWWGTHFYNPHSTGVEAYSYAPTSTTLQSAISLPRPSRKSPSPVLSTADSSSRTGMSKAQTDSTSKWDNLFCSHFWVIVMCSFSSVFPAWLLCDAFFLFCVERTLSALCIDLSSEPNFGIFYINFLFGVLKLWWFFGFVNLV